MDVLRTVGQSGSGEKRSPEGYPIGRRRLAWELLRPRALMLTSQVFHHALCGGVEESAEEGGECWRVDSQLLMAESAISYAVCSLLAASVGVLDISRQCSVRLAADGAQ